MLRMVVMTHNPEAGPVGSETVRESAKIAMQKREQVMSKLDIREIGEWIDVPGHVAFLLVDAPNAHVITQMLAELGLLGWLTAAIHPVIDYREAAKMLPQ